MANNYNFLVPAMLMFLLVSGVGCIFVVIAWARIFTEPSGSSSRSPNALYSFTGSVAVEALGSGLVTTLPADSRTMAWSFVLIAGFALVIACLFCLRKERGPEKPIVKVGAIVIFIIYALGLMSMIVTR